MVGGGDMFINTKPTPSVGLVLMRIKGRVSNFFMEDLRKIYTFYVNYIYIIIVCISRYFLLKITPNSRFNISVDVLLTSCFVWFISDSKPGA